MTPFSKLALNVNKENILIRAFESLGVENKDVPISQQVRAVMCGEQFSDSLMIAAERLQEFWKELQQSIKNVPFLYAKGTRVSKALRLLKEKLRLALHQSGGSTKAKVLSDYQAFNLNVLGDEYQALKC